MRLTRRQFIQAAGVAVGAAMVETDFALASEGGAMVSPSINPAYLTGSIENWPLGQLGGMGYKGLEITPACLANMPSWRSAADAAGLKLVCVNSLPELIPYLTGSLNDAVEHRRRATIDRLLRVLDIMNREQIPILVIAPGRQAENYQTGNEARALLVSGVRELADAAGSVAILVVAAPRRLFAGSAELAGLLDEIARPNVAAALDVGHALIAGERPVDAAQALGHRLKYVQLHDADLRPGFPLLDRHMRLGAGSIKPEEVKPALKGLACAINITAPDDPVDAAREAMAWITEHTAR